MPLLPPSAIFTPPSPTPSAPEAIHSPPVADEGFMVSGITSNPEANDFYSLQGTDLIYGDVFGNGDFILVNGYSLGSTWALCSGGFGELGLVVGPEFFTTTEEVLTPDLVGTWTPQGEVAGSLVVVAHSGPADPEAIQSDFTPGSPTAPKAITAAYSPGTPAAPAAIFTP